MPAIEINRECVITKGRFAGKKGVIVEIVDENYVVLELSDKKRKKINIRHLWPLESKKVEA